MPFWGSAAQKKLDECLKLNRTAVPSHISDPWNARLVDVESTMQGLFNQDFLDGMYGTGKMTKFAPKDPVLVVSNGLYFTGTIRTLYRATLPATLFPPGSKLADVPATKWITTYLIRFDNFGIKHDEEYPENEIIRRMPDNPADILGMLFAHEWNTYQRMQYGCEEREMGRGAWFLEDDMYQAMESAWKTSNATEESFAQHSGRAAAESALQAAE